MSDISNLLIKDSYDYVIQVDPITRQVLRIGGSVPNNPIFVSGLTVENSLKYTNGSEFAGYFLKCDAQGNATWAPVNVSGNTYALTGVTVDGFTLTFTDSEGQVFPITITGGTLNSLTVTGNTIVNNLTGNTINVNQIYISGVNIDDIYVKKVCLPAIISGRVLPNEFSGQPLTYSVNFVTPLPNTDYTVTVTGKDLRIWSIENETVSGFTINTNSNIPLSDYTFWQLISVNNFVYTGSCVCNGTGGSGTSGAPIYKTFLISANTSNLVFDYFYYGVNYNGAVDLYLPSCNGLDGRLITIKDELGNCNQAGKRIRLNPYSGETIDNNSFVDMAISKMSLQLITRGNNWFII